MSLLKPILTTSKTGSLLCCASLLASKELETASGGGEGRTMSNKYQETSVKVAVKQGSKCSKQSHNLESLVTAVQ